MTTYTLKTTPAAGGPVTETKGLTREQTLWALTDLIYGTFEDFSDAPQAIERRDEALAIAA